MIFRGYIPGLDVLRGMAIAMVLVFHGFVIPPQYSHGVARLLSDILEFGRTGVHLFFVLSGFLISGILLDSAKNDGYYRNFYIRRALRILPAYLAMLVVLKLWMPVTWRFVLACLLYIANMAGLVGSRNAEYGSFWSLAVEEQFYLVWPTIIRSCSRTTILRILLACCILSPVVRLACYLANIDSYFKTWVNADYLLYGALVALALRENLLRADNIKRIYWMLLAIAAPWACLSIYLQTIHTRWIAAEQSAVGVLPFMGLYVALLLIVLDRNRGVPSRNPIFRALSFLGYISYGLYLVHSFLYEKLDLLVARYPVFDRPAGIETAMLRGLLGAVASILIAFLSRKFFEEPILGLKSALTSGNTRARFRSSGQEAVHPPASFPPAAS